MTWPREQGHISRTKGCRPLKFSENFTKSLKSSYSKNQISSFKNRGYRSQKLPGGGIHPPPMCERGLTHEPLGGIKLPPLRFVIYLRNLSHERETWHSFKWIPRQCLRKVWWLQHFGWRHSDVIKFCRFPILTVSDVAEHETELLSFSSVSWTRQFNEFSSMN